MSDTVRENSIYEEQLPKQKETLEMEKKAEVHVENLSEQLGFKTVLCSIFCFIRNRKQD